MAASLLQLRDLTKSVGDRMLFQDVTLGVYEGDKIGVIAKNGTGKSTLLSIIAGQIAPDSGDVVFANSVRVAYLCQDPKFPDGISPLEATLSRLSQPSDEVRERATRLLTMVGIAPENHAKPVDHLSGGQVKRIAIAQALLDHPDLLIMDEPTNHLDINTVEWLEKYLKKARLSIVMVTHDRYFLERVCNKILEIDMEQVFTYPGSYDNYLRRRQERIDSLQADVEKARNLLRKEQDWMSRQPQARAGKAKYRIDAFYDLKERASVRYDPKNIQAQEIKSSYIGSKIFEAKDISKRFGSKVILDHFSYTFSRYEKLGIVGENGVGKSTFIKMLQGLCQQDEGEWNVGETVRFGYYSQDGLALEPGKRVIDAVTELTEDVHISDSASLTPMQFLNRFLFTPKDQQKYISTLSGGEKRRLQLAITLMRQPNFLILDEPTNDLDIITLAILEDYLREFHGCVIVVSHDRFFLDSIVDHIFVMEGNGVVKDFPGNYSDYRQWLSEQQKPTATTSAPKEKKKERPQSSRRKSFKEKQLFQALTSDLEALNQEKAVIEATLNSPTPDADIAQISLRYQQVMDELDEKEMQWLELSEIPD